jgi:RNA polymerase Rpb2, domain 6
MIWLGWYIWTVGQLIESLKSKVNTFYLSSETSKEWMSDCTAFSETKIDVLEEMLKKAGYQPKGYETLYSGFTGQMYNVRTFMCPTRFQRLKHLVSDKIHCLLADHDVLTLKGWKPIADITTGDEVACLRNGSELVYEHPTEVFAYLNYEGPMYHIKNQYIDLEVTNNHRMFVSRIKQYDGERKWRDYELQEAQTIFGKRVKYKKDAEWNVPDYQFVLPQVIKWEGTAKEEVEEEKIVDMDAWLIFLGIWIAEGWASGNNNSGTVSIAVNKQRVKDNLYPALEKLGYNYGHTYNEEHNSEDCIHINDKQLYCYIKPFSVGAPNKVLPDWVFGLSRIQTRILIHGMVLGDGQFGKNYTCYFTTSVKLADQFQQLCLHAGFSGTISLAIQKGYTSLIRGKEVVTKHNVLRIGILDNYLNPTVNHGEVHNQNCQEEGMETKRCPVFCLSVPSEVFYVRRNGKTVWTGNSRDKGPIEVMTHQPLKLGVVKMKILASWIKFNPATLSNCGKLHTMFLLPSKRSNTSVAQLITEGMVKMQDKLWTIRN